ncbi:GEVED domain-containing protein [Flavobacterium sp. SM2513]|uniref:GEVED domain-containing protein n=1 Tax=Flavobacterium sp. SM2513 TaxID=3424766 RepID=UPI003D7F36AC
MKTITLNDFEKNQTERKERWRYGLALLFGMFFIGVSSFAQTIQLGSGATTNSYLPLYYLYDKNYTQTIYTAAELTNAGATATGGTITKIRFKPTASVSTVDWRNWTIYMDNTAKIGFESNTDWIAIGDFTQVFTGSILDNTVANTWIEITLSTPFVWDGSNVAVAIVENSPGWGGSPNWASYTLAPSAGNKAIYKYQDGDDISLTAPPAGTRVNAVAQVQFDGTLQLGCTGTPTGGTASLSPSGGNSGANFTASATGVTSASGLTYQWQKEMSGNWINITGATSKNSVIVAETAAIGTVTNYRLAVTCTASAETAYSTTASYTVSLTYCTPTGGGNNSDEMVNFTLSNLNNTSAASEGVLGYSNYSGTVAPAQLSLGTPYIASVKGGTGSGNHGAAIWIDYNQNGTFESSEKVAFIGNTIGANATANFPEFTVPPGTALGIYRLRVQHQYNKSGDLLEPCVVSSTLAETEDYSVQILPIPTCPQPSGLTALNIASASADLSWTSTGSLFDIEYGAPTFVPGTGTMLTGVSAPYALTGLNPNTSYSYYVRKNCGAVDGYSLWSGPFNFKTTCAPVAAFTENFDSDTATGATNPLPSCWTRLGNTGSSYITTGSGLPMSGTKRLLLSGAETGSTNGIAVMPQVSNLQAGTHRLKFKAYSSLVGKSLTIGYYESSDEPLNFVDLETFEMPSTALSSATEFSYNAPTFIPNGVQSLAFRVDGGAFTGTTTIYIDDVIWEAIPECGDLLQSNIILSNIGTSSVDVEWFTEGSETAWQYAYTSDAAVTDPNTLAPFTSVTNSPFAFIESLQPNTVYKFWLRSDCGSGTVGNWSGVKTFTTACAPVTVFPYIINFESVTIPAIPNCTSIQNAGTGNNWKTNSTTLYGFSGKVLNYSYNFTNAANAWFYTNEMTLEAGITYKLSYKYGNDGTLYTEKLKVAYGTSAMDTEMVNELANHPAINGGIAQDNSVSFTPAVTGIYVIGFNAYSAADQNNMYVDNIIVDLAPTTLPVCATNIVATTNATCGNYATTLTWDATPSTNGYNVIIAPTSGGTPVTLNAGNVTTFSYVGNHNTNYTYTVVPYNNIGDAVGCVSQTFTTALNGCYCPSLPTSNDGSGISNVLIGTQNFPNGDVMYFNHTATPVDIAQGVNTNLKVTLATGTSYFTNVWIDLNDNYTFEVDELFFSAETPGTISNPFIQDASFEMPLDAALGQHRMRIVSTDFIQNPANPCYSGTWGVTLDFTVNIIPAPTCLIPSNVSATSITSTSATLNWTASTSTPANGYAYYVTTSTTPPTAATLPTGTVASGVTTVEALELVSSTVYKFYIKSVCSDTDASAWTQAGTFTTLCEASPLPYTIDFESVTVPALPSCTSNQNVGTGNNWLTVSGANSGFTGKYLRYTYSGTNPANTWFFTNVFNLVAGTSYTVSYKYGAGSTAYTEKMKVAYGSAANATAMTTILADHDNVNFNVPQNNSVDFTPTTSGLYVIGFNAYSATNLLYLQVDDIVVKETPSCVPPAIPTVTNITATTANVNWIASSTAATEGYDYYYSTSNVAPTAATTPSESVLAGITIAELSGLTAVTTYYVWVRSKCSTTDVSAWSYSATFTTPCASYNTPFAQDFATYLPSCWSTASAGTIATGPTNAVAGIWAADGFLNNGLTGAARINLYSTNRIGWLITPTLNTTVGENYTFTFDYGVTAYTGSAQIAMGSDDSVKIALSTDNGTTWTEIQNFTNASNITNVSQEFTHTFVATSMAVKFAFIGTDGTVDDTQDYNFYVDNVNLDTALSNTTFDRNVFTAYPNPVKNNLTIRYNETISDATVYNLLGQQIFVKAINATEGQIDMSNLASGTYLVRVNSGDRVETIKVIKE